MLYGIEDNIVLIDEYVPNEEIGNYFTATDLVIQPYISSTGSGVVQIAFGFNRPVVATKVGSLPEIIDDGKTGYLVPPEDPHEIAQAIIKFFRDDNGEKFSKNIDRDKYKFSWNRMVEVIEELVSSKNNTSKEVR